MLAGDGMGENSRQCAETGMPVDTGAVIQLGVIRFGPWNETKEEGKAAIGMPAWHRPSQAFRLQLNEPEVVAKPESA